MIYTGREVKKNHMRKPLYFGFCFFKAKLLIYLSLFFMKNQFFSSDNEFLIDNDNNGLVMDRIIMDIFDAMIVRGRKR